VAEVTLTPDVATVGSLGPQMTEPREIGFDASGLRFAALTWSPPAAEDAPLAVCLHGYPDTAWTWRHLGPYLAERGWRVVAPFMRGYAPTDLAPDGGYQVGALGRDALEFHRALGGDDRAVLIGHDWGAAATYIAGAHSPGTYKRLVSIAVPPPPVLFGPSRMLSSPGLTARQLRCSWYMIFQQFPGAPERVLPSVIRRLWADWSPGYDATEDLAHVADALRPPGRREAALAYYRALLQPAYMRKAYAAEQKHFLGVPDVPMLYLHGRDDGCLLAEIAERAVDVLAPGSRVEILPGVGHFLQLEQPVTANPLIADFVGAAA